MAQAQSSHDKVPSLKSPTTTSKFLNSEAVSYDHYKRGHPPKKVFFSWSVSFTIQPNKCEYQLSLNFLVSPRNHVVLFG